MAGPGGHLAKLRRWLGDAVVFLILFCHTGASCNLPQILPCDKFKKHMLRAGTTVSVT